MQMNILFGQPIFLRTYILAVHIILITDGRLNNNLYDLSGNKTSIWRLKIKNGKCTFCSWNFVYKETIFWNKHIGTLLNCTIPFCLLNEFDINDTTCKEDGGTCYVLFPSTRCDSSNGGEDEKQRSTLPVLKTRDKNVLVQDILRPILEEDFNEIHEIKVVVSLIMTIVFSRIDLTIEDVNLIGKLMMKILEAISKSSVSCDEVKEIGTLFILATDVIPFTRLKIGLPLNALINIKKNLSFHSKVLETTKDFASILDKIPYGKCSWLRPEGKETMIQTSKSLLWSKTDVPHKFSNLSKSFLTLGSYFKISDNLANYLSNETGLISVQFLRTFNNIFMDYRTNLFMMTEILSLSIERKGKGRIKTLLAPIDLFFTYNNGPSEKKIIVKGFARIPSFQNKNEDLDNLISVHKLEPLPLPGNGKVVVTFFNLSTHHFKILLLENIRPNYELIFFNSKEVTYESPCYEISLRNQNRDTRNFLGILAQPEHPQKSPGVLPYFIQVQYFQCQSRLGVKWTSDGCYVGNKSSEKILHCQCWHLSFFGGNPAISPRLLNLDNDIQLITTVTGNPKVFIMLSSLLVFYLMLLVWTRHNDGKDRLQRFVVVLEDNFPGEEWPYLVTVITGFWIGAGTDAKVILRIYGSNGVSRLHNLQTSQRKVLKTNCDDWFMIFTPQSLGNIEKIHLFHDYTGYSPDWYCSTIIVYDLHGERDYKFSVEKWISLCEVDESIEYFIYPTPTEKSLRRDRIAINNVLFGLKETHLLISIFTRHPRSSVTRSQRLSICIAILIVKLLTSIMFYELEESEYPDYSDNKREIIIEMESTLLAAPFTFIVIFCFKKSRIVTASKNDMPMNLMSTEPGILETGLEANQNKAQRGGSGVHGAPSDISTGTSIHSWDASSSSIEEEEVEEEAEYEEEEIEEGCWKNCYTQIKNLLFQEILTKPVMPVKIAEEDEESSHIRKQWMYFAWSLCLSAILASALITLLYSLKMDQNMCGKWLWASLSSSFGNIIMFAPMKIILFSTILAILYGQLQYIPSYECNTELAMKLKYFGNERFLSKILHLRKSKFYRPLPSKKIKSLRLEEKTWRRWRIILDFCVVLFMNLVLAILVSQTYDGLYMESARHVEHVFSLKDGIIRNFSMYINYLVETVIPSTDVRSWYNGDSLMSKDLWNQEMGFLNDHSSRLMGYPRMRQQRVSEDSCKVDPLMSSKFFQCNAPLKTYNTDYKDYSLRWTQPEKGITEKNSSWAYSKSNSPVYICGEYTYICYSYGGYVAKLDYNKTISIETVMNLYRSEWFDGLTRAVMFEMIVYNVNTNLICYVAPLLEKLADGTFHLTIKYIFLHPKAGDYIIILGILLFFSFYYMFRIVLLFNRKGLTYLLSLTGLLDIFLNFLLYMTMLSVIFDRHSRTEYLDQWHAEEETDLTLSTELFLHKESLKFETALLVLICPIRVLRTFRFGKKYSMIFTTCLSFFKFAFGLVSFAIFFNFAFKVIATLNGDEPIYNPLTRCYSLFTYFNSYFTSSPQLVIYTIISFSITNLAILFATVTNVYSYKETKKRQKFCNDFNMITFIFEKIKTLKRKLRFTRRRLSSFTSRRHRGGADGGDGDENEDIMVNRTCDYTREICNDIDFKLDLIVKKIKKLKKTEQM